MKVGPKPTLFADGQPVEFAFDEGELGGAAAGEELAGEQAHGSAADDEDGFADPGRRDGDGVDGAGQRFDDGGLGEGHRVGDVVAVDGGYGDVFGGAAVDGVADGAPAVAEVAAADAAPFAVAAEQGWVDGDPVALVDEVDVGSDGDDFAGELVAGDDREGGGREQAGGDVEVGAADSDGADPDDDFTGAGGGVGCFADVHGAGLVVDDGDASFLLRV